MSSRIGCVKNDKVYKGPVEVSSAQVATIKNGIVYEGRSATRSALIADIEGADSLDPTIIAAMVHFFICPILN